MLAIFLNILQLDDHESVEQLLRIYGFNFCYTIKYTQLLRYKEHFYADFSSFVNNFLSPGLVAIPRLKSPIYSTVYPQLGEE